jgi:hypothetical protein
VGLRGALQRRLSEEDLFESDRQLLFAEPVAWSRIMLAFPHIFFKRRRTPPVRQTGLQRREVCAACLAAAFTRSIFGGKATGSRSGPQPSRAGSSRASPFAIVFWSQA